GQTEILLCNLFLVLIAYCVISYSKIGEKTLLGSSGKNMAEDSDIDNETALDKYIAEGLRLWMLLAMILGVLLTMTIIICCMIKIRIPRSKREIQLNALRRKQRKDRSEKRRAEAKSKRAANDRRTGSSASGGDISLDDRRRSRVDSDRRHRSSAGNTLLAPPGGNLSDVETAGNESQSCSSCELNADLLEPSSATGVNHDAMRKRLTLPPPIVLHDDSSPVPKKAKNLRDTQV
uniref:Uncharacterized protein n=1 Tax=Romanomermis culicivorax TaxID=13658 RepID=A0A915HTE9_ROMCU